MQPTIEPDPNSTPLPDLPTRPIETPNLTDHPGMILAVPSHQSRRLLSLLLAISLHIRVSGEEVWRCGADEAFARLAGTCEARASDRFGNQCRGGTSRVFRRRCGGLCAWRLFGGGSSPAVVGAVGHCPWQDGLVLGRRGDVGFIDRGQGFSSAFFLSRCRDGIGIWSSSEERFGDTEVR